VIGVAARTLCLSEGGRVKVLLCAQKGPAFTYKKDAQGKNPTSERRRRSGKGPIKGKG